MVLIEIALLSGIALGLYFRSFALAPAVALSSLALGILGAAVWVIAEFSLALEVGFLGASFMLAAGTSEGSN
jgi:hypothetical protein